ncbi:MAG: TonB-dependent receptor [Opitutaceae bacterium]|nr:TonB-dependent receptor [Opitutaceae bacterium]
MASYIGYDDVTQTVVVSADGEARANFNLGSEVLQLGKFTVSGEREGQARALQQKRFADNIMDIVSADSAGKLPDGNAAEAVRRLPGVFAEIDQNEGRYVVVRGIDSSLNNITLNGVNLGSTESGSRGAAMDSVPADLIKEIKVKKAVLPSDDAQAIGASVDIVTMSAFDRKETFATLTAKGGYFNGPREDFEEREWTPYNASGLYSTTFGDGKWGIVVGGSYDFRHYISNRRSGGNPWFPAGPVGTPGAQIYFPANQALFHYDVQRWRWGMNAALEYKPNDRNYFALRVNDNRFKDEENREQNNFEFFRSAFPATFTPTVATFTGGRATVEYRYYLQKHNYTTVALEGENTLGDGASKLDYTVAIGNAEKQTPDRQDWEFRSGTNITSTLDIAPEYWTVTPSANFYSAANYPFRRVRFRKDSETEDNGTAEINFKREREIFGREGFWQVGAKYFTREKAWDRTNRDYGAGSGANAFNLSQFNISSPAHVMFGGADGFQMSPQIDLKGAQAFFAANRNYFPDNLAGSEVNSAITDFSIEETLLAGYAMAKVDFGNWSVLAGVRVESNEGEVQQIELVNSLPPPQLKRFSKKLTNVLPGVHFNFTPTKSWVIRASWTNTLGRPNYPDMARASEYAYVEDLPTGSGIYTGSISEGNPQLKPFESMNFDLSSEFYLKNAGIFSISGFHKEVDNPVFTNAFTLRNTTYQGRNFSSLSYTKPENADKGSITGVEFNYQQTLTMLPAPFDGLGFSVNYTLAESEEVLFTRPGEQLSFAKQAPRIYNVALSYEKYRVQARIAYTYTGAFIKAFGSDINADQYQAERKIIDAKVSFRINKNFSVFADVINLGQEPLDEYAGYSNRNQATEAYWWTANFGVTWRL